MHEFGNTVRVAGWVKIIEANILVVRTPATSFMSQNREIRPIAMDAGLDAWTEQSPS